MLELRIEEIDRIVTVGLAMHGETRTDPRFEHFDEPLERAVSSGRNGRRSRRSRLPRPELAGCGHGREVHPAEVGADGDHLAVRLAVEEGGSGARRPEARARADDVLAPAWQLEGV